jgi:collagenase-like PrtC family protease
MNLFVPVHRIEQLASFSALKVSAVILSTAFCSSKTQHPLTMEELSSISKKAIEMDLPWYLSVNRMILQSEWSAFQSEIQQIISYHPAGFIVSDLGVMHYLKKNFPKKRIVLQTDTTITSAQDVEILLTLGVDLVALARELTFAEVTEIVKQHGNQVLISGFGYQSMSTSNRPLMSNYFEHIDRDIEVLYKRFTLQEEGRMERYPAMQDNHGFHIFTSSVLENFEEVNLLESIGLKHLMIDSLFIDEETIHTVIETFNKNIPMDAAIAQISGKYPLSKALYYTPTSAVKAVSV